MIKEIVIAAYDKDLSWMDKFNSDVKQTIYRKGTRHNDNEIFIEPNIGRCVHSFFNHLYTRYETLSDITFFAQDYPFDHWENLITIINSEDIIDVCNREAALTIGGYYGFHFNTIGTMWNLPHSTQFGSGRVLSCYSNGQPQDNNPNIDVSTYFNLLFRNESTPQMYEFMPGGHFGITKEHARLRSKDFYGLIVNLLESNINAPWIIERLECYIFNPKFKPQI